MVYSSKSIDPAVPGITHRGRSFNAGLYRFAFQGQERDREPGAEHEFFQLRTGDGRLGRWSSTDPYGQYHSAYLGMGNNPVSMVDPNGGIAIGGWGHAALTVGGAIAGYAIDKYVFGGSGAAGMLIGAGIGVGAPYLNFSSAGSGSSSMSNFSSAAGGTLSNTAVLSAIPGFIDGLRAGLDQPKSLEDYAMENDYYKYNLSKRTTWKYGTPQYAGANGQTYVTGKNYEVVINNKLYWETDENYLKDVIDHEIEHLKHFKTGLYQKWYSEVLLSEEVDGDIKKALKIANWISEYYAWKYTAENARTNRAKREAAQNVRIYKSLIKDYHSIK